MTPHWLRLVAVALVMACCGCGPSIEVHPDWYGDPPRTIAVLPLGSPDDDDSTLDQVDFLRRELAAQLAAHHAVAVLDLAWTDRRLAETPTRAPADLARVLDVDAVLVGEVTSLANVAPLIGYYRSIGARLQLHRRDGVVLLSAEHTERIHGGPLPDFGGQVLTAVVAQVQSTSSLAFVRLAEAWAEKTWEQVPRSEQADRESLAALNRPPSITAFEAVPSRSGALGPGDRLDLRVAADAHTVAVTVELGQAMRIVLAETEAGRYAGRFVVPPGLALRSDALVAVATGRFGHAGRKSLAQPLVIEARAPDPPQDLEATFRDGRVAVRWRGDPNAESGYVVWRTDLAEPGALTELGRPTAAALDDTQTVEGRRYRYAVAATRGEMIGYPAEVEVAR